MAAILWVKFVQVLAILHHIMEDRDTRILHDKKHSCWCPGSLGLVFLPQSGAITSQLAKGSAAFIWKLHCLWLTHWGRVTHICICKPTIIGSDNGLSPGRRQTIIRTNAGILLMGWILGTNFSEILNEIHTFSFKKMHLKFRLQSGVHLVSASIC